MNRNLGGVATVALLLGAWLSAAACSRQIGDSCQTASDCDPNGTRVCDMSQPGGYCTILGCNETSCPSEAACIRNFPTQFLTRACNPSCEDLACAATADAGAGADASADPISASCRAACPSGPTNDCAADEVCLDVGLCAPRSSEVRACEKTCSSNDDCRGGYACRQSGTQGSMALSTTPNAEVSFCAPLTP